MLNQSLSSILGLTSFKILKIEDQPKRVLIHVKPRRKTATCPTCGVRRSSVHERLKVNPIL